MDALNLSVLLSIIAGITVMTNIIVQVLKKITWDKIPTNLLALIIAEALTLASGGAYAQMNGIVLWLSVQSLSGSWRLMPQCSALISFRKF